MAKYNFENLEQTENFILSTLKDSVEENPEITLLDAMGELGLDHDDAKDMPIYHLFECPGLGSWLPEDAFETDFS